MAQAKLTDFSPAAVAITYGLIKFNGYAEDSFVTLSRNSPNSNASVGADGSVGLTISADKTGSIEVTLMQNSDTHRYLSAIQAYQDSKGVLYKADMTINDPSGGFIAKAVNVHIQEPPEVTLGNDQNEKTWTFFAEGIVYLSAPENFAQPVAEASAINDMISGLT